MLEVQCYWRLLEYTDCVGDSQRNWKKAEGVAKIVARCPLQATSLVEYYNIVCPQV